MFGGKLFNFHKIENIKFCISGLENIFWLSQSLCLLKTGSLKNSNFNGYSESQRGIYTAFSIRPVLRWLQISVLHLLYDYNFLVFFEIW